VSTLRRVRTLVVSDLHIGSEKGVDLLRRPELRAPLLDALHGADRLVILGDGVELRDRPKRDVAEIAAPVFADIGEALGPDGELVLTAGNHDHGLVAGWIDARLETEASGFLGLEQAIEPEAAGPLARRLAEHARPARTRVAYPGVWLREDVYAIHGHYLDVHTTVPTFERLAAGAMARFVVRLPEHGAAPDDYEAVLAPLYAWMNALTQRSDRAVLSAGAGASARAWVALAGGARHRRPLRTAALGAGYVTAVAALNRIGLGPIDRNLSGTALRRGSLRGMSEVIARLGVQASHVIFGHSHRSGPWPRDVEAEWTTPGGGRLVNTGSWIYQRHFLSDEPNASPYWPGTAVVIDDEAPPELIRLLGDRGHAQLAPPRA
jgi:UDP-2,3-diacylglucosamine pyrophosphatase LpxH